MRNAAGQSIHPVTRLVATIFAIASIFINHDLLLSCGAYLILFLLLLLNVKLLRSHVRFLLVVGLPFLAMFTLVYVVFLNNDPQGSFPDGFSFAAFVFLRLVLLTSVLQLFFFIPQNLLFATFSYYRLNGNLLYIWVGANVVWTDIASRSDQIITARYSRGLVANRNFLNRLKQLPYVIKPLLAGIFVTAFERSSSWKQKNILKHIEEMPRENFSFSFLRDILILLASVSWFTLSILTIS
ncbi:MAG TPA: hypothetical protein VE933_12695 [Chitinophagaceae bacterium]|nr:hypothetical protein [Chitinophagaceae bacterium]